MLPTVSLEPLEILHAAIEIHAINSNRRIILDPQINMLTNPKAKVARRREVLFPQLVFLNLKAAFEDFLGFGAADCDVDSDFLVTSDAECAYGVAGFACGERGRLGIGGSFLVGIGESEGSGRCVL